MCIGAYTRGLLIAGMRPLVLLIAGMCPRTSNRGQAPACVLVFARMHARELENVRVYFIYTRA